MDIANEVLIISHVGLSTGYSDPILFYLFSKPTELKQYYSTHSPIHLGEVGQVAYTTSSTKKQTS